MKDAATKSYSKKGEKIVAMNHEAIERGANEYHKVNVPESWKNAVDEAKADVAIEGNADTVAYVKNFLNPVQQIARAMKLPVSTFVDLGMEDGTAPAGLCRL